MSSGLRCHLGEKCVRGILLLVQETQYLCAARERQCCVVAEMCSLLVGVEGEGGGG